LGHVILSGSEGSAIRDVRSFAAAQDDTTDDLPIIQEGGAWSMPPKTTVDTEDYDDIPIEKLGLSVRTYNVLKRNGIHTVGQLLALGDVGQRKLGRSYIEVRRRLAERGFL
jgi:DNA-directed RNA polymerase alpha subunit